MPPGGDHGGYRAEERHTTSSGGVKETRDAAHCVCSKMRGDIRDMPR